MSYPPTGTVTFLFTDIEGSTRLWSERQEAMGAAVERHDQVVRTAIEDNGGYVFATGGDAFSAAFQTTQDALAAAVEAQLTLGGEDWGEYRLRVRMGIHTGEAEERDDNFFGPVVNESARLMSAGHGGQILVSATAQRGAGDRVPDEIVFLDLGERRFRDLDHRIRVYQVTHPDLAVEFPALRGLRESPNNLPRQLTSFVGRDRDLIELPRLLGSSRLVTLAGAGGSGKTRLALEVAREELDSHPDGVWFVDLATVDDPLVVGATVASVLGVSDRAGHNIVDRLVDRLSVEQTLLILDNCEHLAAAAASLTSELLKRSDALVVLATSREPLGITGEYTYPVPTLDAPGAAEDDLESDHEYPAVRLFVDRASLARPGMHWSQDDAVVMASICRRLDGLPLAIELAAARLSILSPGELLERLDDRFGLLVGGARDRLPRQQTLTATIDWSYQLLTDEEKALFGRLSVFSGGFTLDATEGVCAGDGVPEDQILDLVAGLVDKSLVVAAQGRAGTQFRLLETMREYAATKLPTVELGDLRQKHADYFRRLVVSSFDKLWGPGGVALLDRLEDEWPNLRRALAWHFDSAMTQDGLLMAGSLYRLALSRHYAPEVRKWLERFIDADATPSLARARALLGMATLNEQRPDFEEAIGLYREFGLEDELGTVLHNAALNAMGTGDWESARLLLAEADELRDRTDLAGMALHVGLQAEIALQADHDPGRAVELGEASLDFAQESKSPQAILQANLYLGWYRRLASDLEGADAALGEAKELEAQVGQHAMIGATDFLLSELALDQGDVDQAVLHLEENAALFRRVFDEDDARMWIAATPLHLWAEVAVRRQQYAIAVTLLGAQTAVYQVSPTAQRPTQKADADNTLSEARAGLDPASFDHAWEAGTAMSGPAALGLAVGELGSLPASPRMLDQE